MDSVPHDDISECSISVMWISLWLQCCFFLAVSNEFIEIRENIHKHTFQFNFILLFL